MTQRKSRPIDGSRRHFLQTASALSGLGAGTPLAMNLAAMSSAAAQTAPDYKALVCVFLFGGNDQTNTVVPFDADTYQRYYNARLPRRPTEAMRCRPRCSRWPACSRPARPP